MTLSLTEVSDLKLLKDDGPYLAKLLANDLRKLKCFLLLNHWKCRDSSSNLYKDEVLNMSRQELYDCCGSPEHHADLTNVISHELTRLIEQTDSEFRRSIKRDKTHYTEIEDIEHFNTWKRGFFLLHSCIILNISHINAYLHVHCI
jgi:hypothetical protein